jgi:hypothetical protein
MGRTLRGEASTEVRRVETDDVDAFLTAAGSGHKFPGGLREAENFGHKVTELRVGVGLLGAALSGSLSRHRRASRQLRSGRHSVRP